jgi:hypothetical protein
LTREHDLFRFGERRPTRRIDFRERPALPASRWPFEQEIIADDGGNIDLLLARNDRDRLSVCLANAAKRLCGAGNGNSELLLHFAARGGQGSFGRLDPTPRNLPSALLAIAPMGAAGIDQ